MSHHFPGSLALPMNPQTSIERFYDIPVGYYVSNAWPSCATLREAPASVRHDLTDLYTVDAGNTVAFIQNSRDTFHVQNHQQPLYAAMPNKDRLRTLWGTWGPADDNGHTTPPEGVTAKVLQEVAGSGGRWDEALEILGFVPEH